MMVTNNLILQKILQKYIALYRYIEDSSKGVKEITTCSVDYTRNDIIHKSLGAIVMAGSEQEKNSV